MQVAEQIAAAIGDAEWHYDDAIDEMEIVLPAGAGREGRAVLVDDDTILRLDPETNEPLSIIVTAWTHWRSQQLPVWTIPELPRPNGATGQSGPFPDPHAWLRMPREAAARALDRTVRYSTPLAEAVR